MSYDILYNSVFLKQDNYIVPNILIGPSNVWGGYRNLRRPRSWTCPFSYKGIMYQDELKEQFVFGLSDESEIWKQNGKWVNGKQYKLWVERNIKKAVSIETFLMANCLSEITGIIKDSEFKQISSTKIHNNNEFLDWIYLVNSTVKNNSNKIYYSMDFTKENLYMPNYEIAESDEKVYIISGKYGYISKIENSGVTFSKDKWNAILFSYEEIKDLQKSHRNFLYDTKILKQASPVSKDKYVISFEENGAVYYIYGIRKRNHTKSFSYVNNVASAKKYTLGSAKSFVSRYRDKIKNIQLKIEKV